MTQIASLRSLLSALALATAALSLAAGCANEEAEEAGEDQAELVQSDACSWNESEGCTTEDGVSGIRNCEVGEDGYVWGECRASGSSSTTPLVLSFDGAEPTFSDVPGFFDVAGGGVCLGSDWPTARTPWLALDRDGDGRIADGAELFGSMTRLASGERAVHGFEALAELDVNGDGRVDAADPGFAALLVWTDGDSDRSSDPAELAPAARAGLVSIDLAYTSQRICDRRGNCGVERATFRFVDASGAARTGTVVDVHLALR